MTTTETQSANPFAGQWRVVSIEQWNAEFINGGQVHIEFGGNGRGVLQFGCVYGEINCWAATRHGEPAMEWCWEGRSEMIGRKSQGWAVLKGDELHGVIDFHGANANFVAKREVLGPAPRTPK